jgi:hypothetical protein
MPGLTENALQNLFSAKVDTTGISFNLINNYSFYYRLKQESVNGRFVELFHQNSSGQYTEVID